MLPNKAELNLEDMELLFSAENLCDFNDSWKATGVSTDTRDISEGALFVALVGENTDGHDRIAEAIEKSASAVVCHQSWAESNKEILNDTPYIIVNDTLRALGDIARHHRRRFDYPVVAIGGANGKTSTKEMTASIMAQKYNVLKTYKNFNNQIGVPLMLLQMNNEYNALVLEIGTNEPGEIAILSAIAEPTHGLITNIGREHLEQLINLDGVEMEETFLFGYLHKQGGTSFINIDDSRLKRYAAIIDKKVSYSAMNAPDTEANEESKGYGLIGGEIKCDVNAEISLNAELKPSISLKYKDRKVEVHLNTIAYTSGLNAVAAAAIGFDLGLSDEEMKKGLESYKPDDSSGYGRMLLEKAGGISILNDSYNANPESMTAALNTIGAMETNGKKYAVLADMLELGEAAEKEHIDIIKYAAGKADMIYLTGAEMKKAISKIGPSGFAHIQYFADKDGLADELLNSINDRDVLLVKGSRGMRMEKIVLKIKEK